MSKEVFDEIVKEIKGDFFVITKNKTNLFVEKYWGAEHFIKVLVDGLETKYIFIPYEQIAYISEVKR